MSGPSFCPIHGGAGTYKDGDTACIVCGRILRGPREGEIIDAYRDDPPGAAVQGNAEGEMIEAYQDEIVAYLRRIRATLSAPFEWDEAGNEVSHAIGVVVGSGRLLEAADEIESLRARAVSAEAEVKRMKTATHCAYCAQEFPLDTVTADQVSEHIRTCEKHPMRASEAEVVRLTGVTATLERIAMRADATAEELRAEVERLWNELEDISEGACSCPDFRSKSGVCYPCRARKAMEG